MNKRQLVKLAVEGRKVPYVPWHCNFTVEATQTLREHFERDDLDQVLDNHFVKLGQDTGFFEDLGNNRFRDMFGVVWDRSVDKDIGVVKGCLLPEPTLRGYDFPDPLNRRFFEEIPEKLSRYGDCFRVFKIGFSLYERAWTLRGMENLMMDFLDHPDFVRDLLRSLADYNIAQATEALKYDIDAVYFGDDWGQQRGLQMGPLLWRRFLQPVLQRMYAVVRGAGKYVFIHSCGDVDELFDDLLAIGLNCFHPFQPEVMDTAALLQKYRGRLTFHGGLSIQRTLPYGTVADVRRETERLLALGREGSYILAPSHDVPKDVPLENMLAFIEVAQSQVAGIR